MVRCGSSGLPSRYDLSGSVTIKTNRISGAGPDLVPQLIPWWQQEPQTSIQSLVAAGPWNQTYPSAVLGGSTGLPDQHVPTVLGGRAALLDAMIPVGALPSNTNLVRDGSPDSGHSIHRTFSSNRSHGHQHRPPQLHWGHRQRHDLWQQPRSRHSHAPGWQVGYLYQPVPHSPCLSQSTSLSLHRKWFFLPHSLLHFLTLYSLTMMVMWLDVTPLP